MLRSLASRIGIVGLVGVGVVLAHQVVYLVRYGSIYGEALVHAGHGQAWSSAVAVAVVAGTVLLAVALARLHRLGVILAGLAAIHPPAGRQGYGSTPPAVVAAPDAGALLRGWLRSAAIVAPGILVALTVQENVEHLAIGLAAPGPGILLEPDYPFAVPIVLAVSAAVSLVAALLSWRRDVLVARIEAVRRSGLRARRPAAQLAIPWVERRHAAIVGHHIAGRAPPLRIAA